MVESARLVSSHRQRRSVQRVERDIPTSLAGTRPALSPLCRPTRTSSAPSRQIRSEPHNQLVGPATARTALKKWRSQNTQSSATRPDSRPRGPPSEQSSSDNIRLVGQPSPPASPPPRSRPDPALCLTGVQAIAGLINGDDNRAVQIVAGTSDILVRLAAARDSASSAR